MEIKGFYVIDSGDPSVGIFPAQWEITGGFVFEDPAECAIFKEHLREVFELITDRPYVETFEEREEYLRLEDEQYHKQQEP